MVMMTCGLIWLSKNLTRDTNYKYINCVFCDLLHVLIYKLLGVLEINGTLVVESDLLWFL